MKNFIISIIFLILYMPAYTQDQSTAEQYARSYLNKIQSKDFDQWKDLLIDKNLVYDVLINQDYKDKLALYPTDFQINIEDYFKSAVNSFLFIELFESILPRYLSELDAEFIQNLKIIKVGHYEMETYSMFQKNNKMNSYLIPILFKNEKIDKYYVSKIKNIIYQDQKWAGGTFDYFEEINENEFSNLDTLDILRTNPYWDSEVAVATATTEYDSMDDAAIAVEAAAAAVDSAVAIHAEIEKTEIRNFIGKLNNVKFELQVIYFYFSDSNSPEIYSVNAQKGSQELSIEDYSKINKGGNLYSIIIDEIPNPLLIDLNFENHSERSIYELKSDGNSAKVGYLSISN